MCRKGKKLSLIVHLQNKLLSRPFLFRTKVKPPRLRANCTSSTCSNQECFTVIFLIQEMDCWRGTHGGKTPRKGHSFQFNGKKSSNKTQWMLIRRRRAAFALVAGQNLANPRHPKNYISQRSKISKIVISWHNLKRFFWSCSAKENEPELEDRRGQWCSLTNTVEAAVTFNLREHFPRLLPAFRGVKYRRFVFSPREIRTEKNTELWWATTVTAIFILQNSFTNNWEPKTE